MTSQPQPAPGEGRPVGQFLRPLRDLAAWALVAATAVLLFVAVFRLIPAGDGEQFASRTQNSFYDFVNLPIILFPLAAVLLSLLVRPWHAKAKVITVIAAVEYAVAAFFGVIFGILVGVIRIAGFSVRSAFEEFLVRVAWLAVFALAAYATYLIWRHLFYVPKPPPQPGVYGQPQYGAPGGYPGQAQYGQPGGYPPPGQPGYGPPQPGQPGQPAWGQPGQPGPAYGHPGQPPTHSGAPAWGQPPVSAQPAPGQPAPGQPAPNQPASGQPGPGSGTPPGPFAPGQAPAAPPAGQYGGYAEPTQAVPRHDPNPPQGDADRTAMLPDDRPGYGPADQDPPRH